MKKYFGYLVIVIVGIIGFLLMIERTEAIDSNLSKNGNNQTQLFS